MDSTESGSPVVDKLHKVDEVAVIFAVKPATIRQWMREGKLKGVKIGNGHYWRVPDSSVIKLAREMYGHDQQQG